MSSPGQFAHPLVRRAVENTARLLAAFAQALKPDTDFRR